jgi:hypothetical protein
VSVCVQALPSLHGEPFGTVGFEHVPVPGLQVPAVWHASSAVHTTGLPLVHAPARQKSPVVQPFPSLQLVPFVATGFEQTPVAGAHVPAGWH